MRDPRVSPTNGINAGVLPSTVLMTRGSDFAASGTLQLAQALLKASVPFQLHLIDGMIHDFMKILALDGKAEEPLGSKLTLQTP